MNTPEFLAWSLECHCPIRGDEDGSDPERTERQLRAARAFSDARQEGRVFEGFAVDPPHAFRIADVLAIHGGQSSLEAACRNCPCNALAQSHPAALAGCFGFVALPSDERQMHGAVERAIENLALNDQVSRLFAATQPRWYGLWTCSPLGQEQLVVLERITAAVGMHDLALACRTATATAAALHVRLYPRGQVAGPWWRLTPHCPLCHAPWPHASDRQCATCDYVGHSAPDKKRHARGLRPYFPLDRLVGAEPAAELLVRYEAFRAQQQSPDRQQNPLPPGPPDSPPVG